MKRLLLLPLLLIFCSSARADGSGSGACPTGSLGSGVTCNVYMFYVSTTASQSGITLSGLTLTATNGIYFTSYSCKFNGCGNTGTPLTLTIQDNINNPETCFSQPTGSPFTVSSDAGVHQFFQYVWYCPSIPSGVTSFTLNASGTSGFISLWGFSMAGACTTAPCFDLIGATQNTSVTTCTGPNIGSTNFTNELSIMFCTNNNDEFFQAAGTTYTMVYPNATLSGTIPGNMVSAKGIASSGTSISGVTAAWNGNTSDGYWSVQATIKTTSSSAKPANQFNRILGQLWPFGFLPVAYLRRDQLEGLELA